MTTHARVRNFASIIDANTEKQAEETAAMPFVFPHLALMPDAHFGKGSAVGTVIPTLGAVMPAAVGVDIGCGMIAVETSVTAKDLVRTGRQDFAGLREAIEKVIPLSPGNYNRDFNGTEREHTKERVAYLENIAATDDVDLKHSPKWREQLGSLGGGNHFIELCADERGIMWLFLHSGSRGVGNKIAQRHIKIAQAQCKRWWIDLPNPDLAYLVEGTDEFVQYIRELHWAQSFAFENRAEMMDRYVTVFAEWAGIPRSTAELDRVNTHHNYTVNERLFGKSVWLTRKGAIDANVGVRGLIPGSMGTASFVVTGKGNPDGLFSAPHGAGRVMSRNAAKAKFTEADLDARMKGIEYRKGAAWVDEIPDAYKDVFQVMHDAESLVSIDHTLNQLMNVKGT